MGAHMISDFREWSSCHSPCGTTNAKWEQTIVLVRSARQRPESIKRHQYTFLRVSVLMDIDPRLRLIIMLLSPMRIILDIQKATHQSNLRCSVSPVGLDTEERGNMYGVSLNTKHVSQCAFPSWSFSRRLLIFTHIACQRQSRDPGIKGQIYDAISVRVGLVYRRKLIRPQAKSGWLVSRAPRVATHLRHVSRHYGVQIKTVLCVVMIARTAYQGYADDGR